MAAAELHKHGREEERTLMMKEGYKYKSLLLMDLTNY